MIADHWELDGSELVMMIGFINPVQWILLLN